MSVEKNNPVVKAALDELVTKTRVIQYGQQKVERSRAILTDDEQRVADAQAAQREIVKALAVLGIPQSEASALISQTINEWHAEQDDIKRRRLEREAAHEAEVAGRRASRLTKGGAV